MALETLVFEDLGDGRTRLTATSLVDSFEGRDAFVASGMEPGVIEGYERLDELFAAADGGRGGRERSLEQALDGPLPRTIAQVRRHAERRAGSTSEARPVSIE